MDLKIVPLHSAPVAILDKNRDLSKVSNVLSRKASNENSQDHAAIRVAKQINILPETESPVVVVTS